MASRREFLRSSLACSALTAAPSLALADLAAPLAPLGALERFVLDSRFAAAVSAAAPCLCSGVRTAQVRGDVTSLWYDDLDLRWKARPMTLAGATTQGALFVLETLAMDRGMRVVYRGRHAPTLDGRIEHTLDGPADLVVASVPRDGSPLWQRLGAALARWPHGGRVAQIALTTPADAPLEEPLVTWVIAPYRVRA